MATFKVYETEKVTGEYSSDRVTEKGCDGTHHAENVYITVEGDGNEEVVVDHVRTRLIGPCDGSCETRKKAPQGSFECSAQ